MNIDRLVMLVAGLMVLTSLALSALVSPWWLLLAAFVGANLAQASVTGFCPLALVLRRVGAKSGQAF